MSKANKLSFLINLREDTCHKTTMRINCGHEKPRRLWQITNSQNTQGVKKPIIVGRWGIRDMPIVERQRMEEGGVGEREGRGRQSKERWL